MSMLVWRIEWKRAGAEPRAIAIRVLGALAIAVLVATGGLPESAGTAAFVALFVGYGVLRAAMSIFEDDRSGLGRRVLSGGIAPASYLLQKAGAAGALSFVGLLPALAVVEISVGAGVLPILAALVVIALSLWIAGVLGVLVGSVSNSATEVLVLSGVVLVLALHMSGVFTTPSPNGIAEVLESASPFAALHEVFVSSAAAGPLAGVVPALVWGVASAVAVGLFAPRLTAFPARS